MILTSPAQNSPMGRCIGLTQKNLLQFPSLKAPLLTCKHSGLADVSFLDVILHQQCSPSAMPPPTHPIPASLNNPHPPAPVVMWLPQPGLSAGRHAGLNLSTHPGPQRQSSGTRAGPGPYPSAHPGLTHVNKFSSPGHRHAMPACQPGALAFLLLHPPA